MVLAALLVVAAPTFDSFDEPLDPARWYIGVGQAPRAGRLRIPKGGWIVSRLPAGGEGLRAIEILFRSRSGQLEVSFFRAREPLSSPLGEPLLVARGKGDRRLAISAAGATLDGKAVAWAGAIQGAFRLRALRGDIEIDEVRVRPRLADPAGLERRVVHRATTPRIYHGYTRATMTLWDVEVCFLVRRSKQAGFKLLSAPVKGAPVLAALVSLSDGKALALKSSRHPLAALDWRDEKRNLSPRALADYLATEYRLFEVIQQAQRALNAALPGRAQLGALVHLAVIRHSPNAHAAIALAESQGAKAALAALRKATGRADWRRLSADRIRAAAGRAARAVLGENPPQWPGFSVDPQNRYATIQQGKDLVR